MKTLKILSYRSNTFVLTALFSVFTNLITPFIVVAYPIKAYAVAPDTVKICHSTGSHFNPYIENSPSKSGDVSGHDGHEGPIWFPGIDVEWGDIIPPFEYDGGSYPGKNWDSEGVAIWENDCEVEVEEEEYDLTVYKLYEDNEEFISGDNDDNFEWRLNGGEYRSFGTDNSVERPDADFTIEEDTIDDYEFLGWYFDDDATCEDDYKISYPINVTLEDGDEDIKITICNILKEDEEEEYDLTVYKLYEDNDEFVSGDYNDNFKWKIEDDEYRPFGEIIDRPDEDFTIEENMPEEYKLLGWYYNDDDSVSCDEGYKTGESIDIEVEDDDEDLEIIVCNVLKEDEEPICGNGIVEEGEECDGEALEGFECVECKLRELPPEPVCGDGILDEGEQCDYGEENGNSACSSECTIDKSAPFCEEGEPEPSESPFLVLDAVNIGDHSSEVGHNMQGWSTENLPGNYGGKDDGTYRQIIGENECTDDGREASFVLHAGDAYANSLRIQALDGMSNLDSFEVYINGNYWGEYKDIQDSSEVWYTFELPLDNLTGDIEVKLKATDNIWPNCSTYGQVAISWAEIEGYYCEEDPITNVRVCKRDTEGEGLEGWTIVLRSEDLIDAVTVIPDGGGYYSSDLPEGDYVLLARGTYEYRGSSGLLTDPGYSERKSTDPYSGPFFPWINIMNLGTPGALGIMINDAATNWSDYLNDDHKYALGFKDYSGSFKFSVYDNAYSDNVGNLYVDIYEGLVGITGEDGCYTFEEILEGNYIIEEINQHSWEPQGSTIQEVSVDEENNEFTFTNEYVAWKGFIQGTKFNDLDDNGTQDIGEPGLSGWVIYLDHNTNGIRDIGDEAVTTDANGDYTFLELDPGTYVIREELVQGWTQTYPTSGYHEVTLSSGIDATDLDFGNREDLEITGHKYIDLDGSGDLTEGDEPGEGWEIRLCRWESEGELKGPRSFQMCNSFGNSVLTDENGEYSFTNLPKGRYEVREVNQDYFNQTGPTDGYCMFDFEEGIEGEAICDFFNQPVNPELFISKEVSGGVQNPGGNVTFTITIRATGSPISGVQVIDLPSEGFEYRGGSARVDGVAPATEPNYSSPGVWDIGDMNPGDEVVLTYIADIDSNVDAGLYKDLAWAEGTDIWAGNVLGEAEDPGKVTDTFVGTQVEVTTDPEDIEVEVDVEEDEEIEEVLGAATSRLPATGATTTIVYILLALGFMGGLLLMIGGLGKMLKARKIISVLFIAIGLGVFTSKVAYAGVPATVTPISVRIEEPETPVNDEFNVTFVAMNTEDKDMVAKCYVKGPSDAIFSQFGSDINVTSGGDSYNCVVDGGVLGFTGTYTFRVDAQIGSWSPEESDEVAVYFDESGPDRPKYIEKDKKNSCEYEIEFKTADDGETSYVEVYREFNKEMDLNSSTRIRTIIIGPDEKHEFDETLSGSDCDKTPYYAVVAFDNAGNASDPRAEEVVTKVTVTIESEGEEEVTQAIYIPSGGDILGVEEGAEEGLASEVEPSEAQDGDVLGEEGAIEMGRRSFFKSPWFWLILVAILVVLRRVTKKKEV